VVDMYAGIARIAARLFAPVTGALEAAGYHVFPPGAVVVER
jgi:hypothetical protein